ncbi:MAG: tetratricopeptide repeat protein [Puniceicoccales bacterium]|jgi:tetratricopeptide (TPR) repeat protein|nr:tetratricopeptide repeat protein [Puniceicoccales bacterium]
MAKTLLKDIDPRRQKQAQAAEQALRTNPQYAVEIAQGLLASHPDCVELRRLLRKAQKFVHATPGKGLAKLFSGVGLGGLLGNSKLVENKPEQAIEKAEKALAQKPTDATANKLLATAAEKLGWYDTAAFAYEELILVDPKNLAHPIAAANAHIKDNNHDEALRIADEALKRFPGNGELQEIARRASVAKTVQRGQWEGDGDYRNKLKKQGEAVDLEKGNRIVQSAEDAARIAAEYEEKIAADPENVDYYREAIRQYEILGNLDQAILTLQRARQTTIGRADAALEKQEHELSIRLYAQRVDTLEKQLAADPGNTALRAEYEQERANELAYKLHITQSLVERYPNDYGYRYNLGIILLQTGNNDDAIQQLQIAQRNPKNRHSAMLNLARAFINGNKFDLAADQLQTAKSEILTMNDTKKEIIYELGGALEKLGRDKDAQDEYKSIYMIDAGYKDVARKMNAYYPQKP